MRIGCGFGPASEAVSVAASLRPSRAPAASLRDRAPHDPWQPPFPPLCLWLSDACPPRR